MKNREKDEFKINKIAPKKQYFNGITESFRGIFRVTGISVVTIITIDFEPWEKCSVMCKRTKKKIRPVIPHWVSPRCFCEAAIFRVETLTTGELVLGSAC